MPATSSPFDKPVFSYHSPRPARGTRVRYPYRYLSHIIIHTYLTSEILLRGDPAVRRHGCAATRPRGCAATRLRGDPAVRRPGCAATRLCGDPAARRPGCAATQLCGDPAVRRLGCAATRLCGDPAGYRSCQAHKFHCAAALRVRSFTVQPRRESRAFTLPRPGMLDAGCSMLNTGPVKHTSFTALQSTNTGIQTITFWSF